MKVAILLTVFNRKEKTLACLRECLAQANAFKREEKYTFSCYLTDDGCTDGTAEAVRREFPEVKVISSRGGLYWNRGMCLAWNEAAKEKPDFYLWLNDDTILKDGALSVLLENSAYLGHKAIVVGTAVDSDGKISYGGRTRSGKIIEPGPIIPRPCDIFNGNLVLVPDTVYKVLGTMDPFYSHSFGDYDYGVRAEKEGIISAIAPGILAECDRNTVIPAWRDGTKSLRARYKALAQPKGRPFKEQFRYDARLYNVFYAVIHFLTVNLRVLIPVK